MSKAVKIVLRTLYDHCEATGFKHPHMIIAKEFLEDIKIDVTIKNIKLIAFEYFNITLIQGDSKSRKREIVQARQIAMTIAKEISDEYGYHWSLASIGWNIGNKDHATVLHSRKTVNNLCDTNRVFLRDVNNIREIIRLKFKPTENGIETQD